MSKQFCLNCQQETEFKKGHCPDCFDSHDTCCTCGGPMQDKDKSFREYRHCPNACEFENIVADLQDEPLDEDPTEQTIGTIDDDFEYNFSGTPITKSLLKFCWKCKEKTIDSINAQKDKVEIFGHICPICNSSIREDPKLLISIAKRLGLSPDQRRFKYLKKMVDDLKRLPK